MELVALAICSGLLPLLYVAQASIDARLEEQERTKLQRAAERHVARIEREMA